MNKTNLAEAAEVTDTLTGRRVHEPPESLTECSNTNKNRAK